jgi:O-antigen/teichoic acid export membrane protein
MTGWHELIAIARNAASAYGIRALRALSVLVITPYLFRRLGTGGFGTWSVMFTMTTVFALLEYGFATGVTKLVAEQRGAGQTRDVERTLGAAIVIMGGLGVLAAVVSAAMGIFGSGLAAGSEQNDFRIGMLVIGAAMLFRFPLVAYGAGLMGYQRFDLYNLAEAVTIVGFTGGTIAAVESGWGVLGLAIAFAGSLVAGGLMYILLLLRTDRALSLRPRAGDSSARRRIEHFSSLTLLADSMVFIGQRMDTVVIAALRNASAAAPFAAANKLTSGLQGLTFPFVVQLMPMTSDLRARGRDDEIVRRFTIATRIALQLTLPFAVAFSLFATDIVDVWLGSGAPDVTAAIIIVLMGVQVVTLSAFPAEKVLVGIGRVRAVGTLALIEGLSNLGVSIGLVSAYGAIGAALGTLFTSAVLAPIKFPLACRATHCSTPRFLRDSIVPAILSSLPAVAAMLTAWLLLPSGALRLVVGLALGIVISIAVGAVQVGPRETIATLRTIRASAAPGAT